MIPVTGGRVLVVDDSEVARAVITGTLEAEGHEVVAAADGQQALRLAAQDPPEVVLLDLEMPGLSGLDVLGRLKRHPVLAAVPVVFLTARTGTGDLVAALAAGAHDYLRKPWEPEELVARVSAALRVSRLQAELQRHVEDVERLSRTDALTGLANRRQLETTLEQQAALSHRYQVPLAVLLIDVDHFKSVNDTHGHGAGDAVLAEVARRLQDEVRVGDVAGRWGGEEFLVIAPLTTAEQVQVLADRLLARLRGSAVDAGDGLVVPVTVSAGAADLAKDGDIGALLRRADEALYAAKDAGRDRVVLR